MSAPRSPEVTSRIMAAVKHTDTCPELALRRAVHAQGLRFRISSRLVDKPDMVFAKARVACFVDGDRWHGNGWRARGYASFDDEFKHANSGFWKAKIIRNVERDVEVNQQLEAAGWRVFRVCASAIEQDVERVADDLEAIVKARLAGATR